MLLRSSESGLGLDGYQGIDLPKNMSIRRTSSEILEETLLGYQNDGFWVLKVEGYPRNSFYEIECQAWLRQ